MRRKLLIAFGVVAAALAVFLTYVALQPSDFKVTRAAAISAPPEKIFPHINDFHAWDAWSPWAKLDPNAKNSFSGAEAGVGAVFQWSGNSDVGEGKMTLVESVPSERIRIRLDFTKPFEDTSHAEFTLGPAPGASSNAEGGRTLVTWTMEGKNNFIGRLFCVFMNMDKMLGNQFVEGLANLKKVVEEESEAVAGSKSSPAGDAPASDAPDAVPPAKETTPANGDRATE